MAYPAIALMWPRDSSISSALLGLEYHLRGAVYMARSRGGCARERSTCSRIASLEPSVSPLTHEELII